MVIAANPIGKVGKPNKGSLTNGAVRNDRGGWFGESRNLRKERDLGQFSDCSWFGLWCYCPPGIGSISGYGNHHCRRL